MPLTHAPLWFVQPSSPVLWSHFPALPTASSRANVSTGKPTREGGDALQGHIRRRASGSWEYILDVGRHRAQRCQDCGKRFWIERRPKELCPTCGGELRETEERRRETKAGFASRKDCQAALTRKLTTLAEHTYVLPSHLSLREFLLKVWLPAIESGVRQTDALRLSHAGGAAPRTAAGSSAAAELKRRPDQRPLRQAAQ